MPIPIPIRLPKISNNTKQVVHMFFGWRIALFIVAIIADNKLSTNLVNAAPNLNSFWNIWLYFDVSWYHDIAINGYTQIGQTAFFPLWPLLIRAFQELFSFIDVYIISFILANSLLLINLFLLTYFISIDHKKSIVTWSLIYLLIFPTAFFFGIGYSESLFLTLVLLCFIFARKNIWYGVAISGILLTMTRPIGIIIVIPMLIAYFEYQKISLLKIKWNILYIFAIPLGIALYSTYLSQTFNDPFAFITAQNNWQRSLDNSAVLPELLRGIRTIFNPHIILTAEWVKITILYLFYLLPIGLSCYFAKHKKYAFAAYILLGSLIPLSTGIGSFERFIIVLFPIYIGLAELTNRYSYLRFYLVPLSMGLLFLYLSLFVNGFWVA